MLHASPLPGVVLSIAALLLLGLWAERIWGRAQRWDRVPWSEVVARFCIHYRREITWAGILTLVLAFTLMCGRSR